MYKISEFAQLSRVSAKMLRHYDALGLLRPAHTDPFTGYRFYTAEQLARLNRLVVFKDLGFSLDQIATLLDDGLPVDQIKGMLMLRQAAVERQLREEQLRLERIAARLRQIEREGQPPAYEVIVRPVAALPVATAKAVLPDDEAVAALLNEVEWYVGRQHARAARPPTVVYHGCEGRAMQVEVAVPLSARLASAGRVGPGQLPGTALMACLVHTGYATLGAACGALHAWVADHGYQVVGPMRETYLRYAAPSALHIPPAFVAARPEAAITELQLPVALAPIPYSPFPTPYES